MGASYVFWYSEQCKIVSFHEVCGYSKQKFSNYNTFIIYIEQMVKQGYKFQ